MENLRRFLWSYILYLGFVFCAAIGSAIGYYIPYVIVEIFVPLVASVFSLRFPVPGILFSALLMLVSITGIISLTRRNLFRRFAVYESHLRVLDFVKYNGSFFLFGLFLGFGLWSLVYVIVFL